MKSWRMLIHAAQIADGEKVNLSPGAMLIDRVSGRVLAAGAPERIGPVPDAEFCDLTSSVVIPSLVNAHAHLDLTHIGPMPWTQAASCESGAGGFVEWVDVVRSRRATQPEQIRASVLDGARRSVAGGTAFIGDIAGVGSRAAVEALRDSELAGVSYLEIFGQGAKEESAIASLQHLDSEIAESDRDGVRLGLQPHAPYSCSRRVYEEAAMRGLPLATHLAETPEELIFVRDAGGPLAELLRRLGVWDERIEQTGLHPIDHLASVLAEHPFLAAHLNYVEDRHLDQLVAWPISVVYCPRASAYFGHPQTSKRQNVKTSKCSSTSVENDNLDREPPFDVLTFGRFDVSSHRYREMLDRGINVALGTDSILCLDTPDRISVLDEMRLLLERDSVDPHLLLRMATVNGAKALGIEPEHVTFSPDSRPGALALPIDAGDATEPLRQALSNASSVSGLRFIIKPGHGAPSDLTARRK